MGKLFTKEQAKAFVKEGNFKDADQLWDAMVEPFKDILQAALEAEMDAKLGYSKYDWRNKEHDNSRNGHTKKTVLTKTGEVTLDIPRDTNQEFEPIIVKKNERRINPSIDDVILSMYAKGMSDADINRQMFDIYKVDLKPDMISSITDKIMPIAKDWQNRPLPELYTFVFLDGIIFNVRQDGQVVKKTAYIVYGINAEGKKEILGIWIGEAESAKFWMKVLTDIKNRGVKDILIVSVDGLKGFEEAITAVFPQTEIQQCIVHQIRTSTRFVNYKDRNQFSAELKTIYTAPNEETALEALNTFDEKWGAKYPYAAKSWRANWKRLATFFRYPDAIRHIMYTTNIIENFNRQIRKATKNKPSFPTDDSLIKIIYLVIQDTERKWAKPIYNWSDIINPLRVHFGERIDKYLQGGAN